MARSIVVSNVEMVRSAAVIGIGTGAAKVVNAVPRYSLPCPSSTPATSALVHKASHSRIHGQAAAAEPVVIADEMARSPVIDNARVPNHRPSERVGVPVVLKLPAARIDSLLPARSLPAGITGTFPSV